MRGPEAGRARARSYVLLTAGCLLLTVLFSSCHLVRLYKVRKFNLADHDRLPSVAVPAAPQHQALPTALRPRMPEGLVQYLDTALAGTGTAAFLILRGDSIVYERYFNGYSAASLLPSFSVAKSYVGTLAHIAFRKGVFPSDTVAITGYVPELLERDPAFSRITLRHLLDMRSGIRFREGSYNLRDEAIKLGFRPNIRKHGLRLSIESPPGTFAYRSINTFLVTLALERATGKTLPQLLTEWLWHPMGASRATMNVDSDKRQQALGFAGLNATARDYLRFGRLMLQEGRWNGTELLDAAWVRSLADTVFMAQHGHYRDQWWGRRRYPGRTRLPAFAAQGMLQQTLYIEPREDLVILRLGRFWKHPKLHSAAFVTELAERL